MLREEIHSFKEKLEALRLFSLVPDLDLAESFASTIVFCPDQGKKLLNYRQSTFEPSSQHTRGFLGFHSKITPLGVRGDFRSESYETKSSGTQGIARLDHANPRTFRHEDMIDH